MAEICHILIKYSLHIPYIFPTYSQNIVYYSSNNCYTFSAHYSLIILNKFELDWCGTARVKDLVRVFYDSGRIRLKISKLNKTKMNKFKNF